MRDVHDGAAQEHARVAQHVLQSSRPVERERPFHSGARRLLRGRRRDAPFADLLVDVIHFVGKRLPDFASGLSHGPPLGRARQIGTATSG